MPSKDLTFRLLGEDSTATLALRRLSGEAEKTAKHFSGAFKLAGAAVAGIGLAGVGAVAAIVKTGIGEAMDGSAGMAQLTAGIKSTGGAANVTVGHMEDLASSIQSMSGQTDDSVVKAEQLLLTFTGIKNQGPNKIFDQATQAAADMAAKMGGDASGSAVMLGKALNDPVKGITALTKVGVSFTEQQKKQVAAMVKSGDTVGAQKIILHELGTEFGGAAKAAGQSLPGQLQRAQRAFEDMSQTVMETILPVVTPAIEQIIAALKKATPFMQQMAGIVAKDMANAFKSLAPVVMDMGRILVTQVVPAIAAFAGWIGKNRGLVIGIVGVIVGLIAAYKAYTAIMAVVRLATALWAAGQAILNVILTANPVGIVIIAIVALIAIVVLLVTHWSQVCKFLQNVWGAVCKWFGDTLKSIGRLWDGLWKANQRLFTIVWGAIAGFFRGIWNGIVNWFMGSLRAYLNFWHGIWTAVSGFFGNIWGRILGVVKSIPQRIMSAFTGAGKWLFDAGKSIVSGLIDGIRNMIGGAAKAAGDVMGAIANFFPHSPAKEGPFSGRGWTLYSGQALAEGFASGITGSTPKVHGATKGLFAAAGSAAAIGVNVNGSVTGSTRTINAANGGGTHVHLHVQGMIFGDEARLGQAVYKAVQTATRQGAVPKTAFTTL